jgi:hypothetical protein
MHEGLVPDVSLGTHFFNDLVEMDMLYAAVYPGRTGSFCQENLIMSIPNRIGELVPDASIWSRAVHVIESGGEAGSMRLTIDSMKQEGMLYI